MISIGTLSTVLNIVKAYYTNFGIMLKSCGERIKY